MGSNAATELSDLDDELVHAEEPADTGEPASRPVIVLYFDLAGLQEAHATIAAIRQRQADPQIEVRKAAAAAVRTLEKKPEPKKEPEKKQP